MHLDRDDHPDWDLQQACEVVASHNQILQACPHQTLQVHPLLHHHLQSLLESPGGPLGIGRTGGPGGA